MVKGNSCAFQNEVKKKNRTDYGDDQHSVSKHRYVLHPPPLPFLLRVNWVCLSTAWNSYETNTPTQVEKGGSEGIFGHWIHNWSAPSHENYKQRKWEKEVERAREWSFLASSSLPTSLSSWLFGQTKASDNAGAAVLTAWSWERWKGPGGSVNGTVRMFLQDDCALGGREATKACVQTHSAYFLTRQARMNRHSHLSRRFAQS